MAAPDIEYIELYTADETAAIDYFVSSFGFTLTAESVVLGRRSSLLRHGNVQLVLTAGRGTERFLDAHGDGIADIAFACDDPAATRDNAVAAGSFVLDSAPGRTVVSGFGDTCHTLLGRPTGTGLPGGHDWVPCPGATTPAAGRILRLDHVAVCVEGGTLEVSAEFYTRAFGLHRYSSEYIEIGDQAMGSIVVRSPSGGVTFTILEQDLAKKPGQVEAFLSRNGGPGTQHLAFLVDDIVAAVQEFGGHGIEFLPTPRAYYDSLAERLPAMPEAIADLRAASVLADRDEWGYLLQLFTRSPYDRNTLFYELVDRRGARGFGSANIRALYEAVERDRLAAG